MLKLHGFAVSNYFNMVRMALMEKGAPFEIVETYPSQESTYLARSPLGKVPCLETGHGFLSETSVMLGKTVRAAQVPAPSFKSLCRVGMVLCCMTAGLPPSKLTIKTCSARASFMTLLYRMHAGIALKPCELFSQARLPCRGPSKVPRNPCLRGAMSL